jgi:hypothetical protein
MRPTSPLLLVPSIAWCSWPSSATAVQLNAPGALLVLARKSAQHAAAIAAAGAVSLLVQLLGPGTSVDLQLHAVSLLRHIADTNAAGLVVDAGGMPPLVQLLGTVPIADGHMHNDATAALINLGQNADGAFSAMVAAGVIPGAAAGSCVTS